MKTQKTTRTLLTILAILLPWHGLISVLFPTPLLFWKEAILLCLFFICIDLKSTLKLFHTPKQYFQYPTIWAILFCLWLLLLIAVKKFDYYSIIAARYLGTGFLTFIISTWYLSKPKLETEKNKKIFTYFIHSCVLSVLFGTWMKFGNGFEALKNFYSPTISSWVPGQIIPIFHETNGLIRMQGASSGPIEFSHLLLIAVFFLLFFKSSDQTTSKNSSKWILLGILAFGIFQSFSRAAIGAMVILISLYLWQIKKPFKITTSRKWILSLLFICLTAAITIYKKDYLYQNLFRRAGTSAHFTRPIEGIKIGLKQPFFGNLGSIGPAARTQNLRQKNDDRAFIAENIFVDYWIQTGVLGLF